VYVFRRSITPLIKHCTDFYSPSLAPVMFVMLTLFGAIFMLNLIISFLSTAIADAEAALARQTNARKSFDGRNRLHFCAL
jgi:hypothetical protein